MAVDRASATEEPESVEERPAPDRSPPPDRPGVDDHPSRSDSRKAAAEADEGTAAEPSEDRSGVDHPPLAPGRRDSMSIPDQGEASEGEISTDTDLSDAEPEGAGQAAVVTDVPREEPADEQDVPQPVKRSRPEAGDADPRPGSAGGSVTENRPRETQDTESFDEGAFWTSPADQTIGTIETASQADGNDRPDTAAERPLYPEVTDRSDYAFTDREYAFAGISPQEAWDMQERRAPLGTQPEQWNACVGELIDALAAEGIADGDVRLKGSAARFCSENPKKWFPQSEDDVRARVGDHYRNAPLDERAQRVQTAAATYREAGFAEDRAKPAAPFFDSMYKLDATNELSDYDFQVASDDLAHRFQQLEMEDPATGWRSENGGHYKHRHLERVAPALHEWAGRWEGILGREVTIATFDHRGPSTGLHDSDWKVIEPEEPNDQ
jgi:hypothetical protein